MLQLTLMRIDSLIGRMSRVLRRALIEFLLTPMEYAIPPPQLRSCSCRMTEDSYILDAIIGMLGDIRDIQTMLKLGNTSRSRDVLVRYILCQLGDRDQFHEVQTIIANEPSFRHAVVKLLTVYDNIGDEEIRRILGDGYPIFQRWLEAGEHRTLQP